MVLDNKRGTARDVMLVVIVLFILGIAVFVLNFMVNYSVDQIILHPQINSSSEAVDAFNSLKTTSARFDYIIFGVFIGMVLALIITSWFIGGHPIFMFIYFLVVVIAVVVSAVLSNVWESISGASVFGSTLTAFPLTNHLLTYLPFYAAAIGMLGLVVMFAKPLLSNDGGIP